MQLRSLGSTQIQVSVLGLGTVKFGRNQRVKYPQAFTIPDDRQVSALLEQARDVGINVLDTAPAYGCSEERLGRLLPGKREDWVLVTKAGEEFVNEQSYFDFTPQHIEYSVKRSLQRLRTDYLDVVLVHSDGRDQEIIEGYEVFATLAKLKQQGWIRAFGMSTKTEIGGRLTVEHADVVMATYNPMYTEEQAVLEYAYEQKKGVLIKKALASGHLLRTQEPNPVRVSLQFALHPPAVSSVVIGTIDPDHLAANAALVSEFFL